MQEKFDIMGMSCAACASHVDNAVRKVEGVKEVNVNLLTNMMEVTYDETLTTNNMIIEAVKKAGYDAKIKEEKIKIKENKKIDKNLILLIISIIDLIILMYFSMGNMMWNFPAPSFIDHHNSPVNYCLLQLILSLPIIIIYRNYFISGYKKLFSGHPNMDTLIAIGASFSIIYSLYCTIMVMLGNHIYHMYLYYEAACMILVFVSIGKYLESLSKKKTTKAIEELIDLSPKKATLFINNTEKEVLIDQVKVGDILIVKKGDIVPVDGIIIKGAASIDTAIITGEAIPKEAKINDEVYQGTIITAGVILIEAKKVGKDTSLENIISLVEEASSSKAPISKLADKVSAIFVPIILGIALLTFIGNFLYLNIAHPSWYNGDIFETALNYAITVIVIACPCALGLATPVAIMVGTGIGAKNGLLIKNAEILEAASKIDTVVLDKTGTITYGKPKVIDFIKYQDVDLYSILYNFEINSEHPLASSIIEYTKNKAMTNYEITEYKAYDGKGISGYIGDDYYEIGNLNFENQISDDIKNQINDFAESGKTPIIIFCNKKIIGLITLIDEIKETSKKAIKSLQQNNIKVVMLTGDNEITANKVAKEVGVDKVYANILPIQKQDIIKELKINNNGLVAMVGDGVNDALALTTADIGIAIGAGSDVAIESSDIILQRNDLLDVLNVIKLSKRTLNTIKVGLFWAFFYNFICVFLSLGILYYVTKGSFKMEPMYGAIAMSISSVSVVLNALTINLFKIKHSDIIDIDEKGDEDMFNNKIIEIDVEGMMCENCVRHVEEACKKIDGVKGAKASLENKKVNVKCKNNVDKDILIKAINEAGYKAK